MTADPGWDVPVPYTLTPAAEARLAAEQNLAANADIAYTLTPAAEAALALEAEPG